MAPTQSHELVYGRTSGGVNKPVLVDAAGVVQVGGAGGGGTSSTFGAAFPSGGTAVGFKDSGGTLMQPGNLDASGNIKVAVMAGGGGGTAPSVATNSTKSVSGTVQTALALNTSRLAAEFTNDSDDAVYLKYGAAATTSDYLRKLLPGEWWALPRTAFTGQITCIWGNASAAGSLRIVEFT